MKTKRVDYDHEKAKRNGRKYALIVTGLLYGYPQLHFDNERLHNLAHEEYERRYPKGDI